MLTDNANKFLEVYKKKLVENHQKHPEKYVWPLSELEEVFGRMKNAIIRGSFNKDSETFRATCRELKIKHTYRDIETFLGVV